MYALTWPRSTFFPLPISAGGWAARANYDLWRLGLEWLLLLAVWAWVPRLWTPQGRRWLRRGAFALLLLFFIYQTYEAIVVALYHNTPNVYNDAIFLGGGIGFLLESLQLPWWVYPAALLGMGSLGALIYLVATTPITRVAPERLSPWTRRLVLALAGLALAFTVWAPQDAARPEGEVASLTLKVAANLREAAATRQRVLAMQQMSPYQVYNYSQYPLAHRPNLYLIFFESYGSVLVTDPAFRPAYRALMDEIAADLAAAGWHTATGLSRSPVWGGGSWMAYTSMLCGVHLAQQPQYLALKYSFQHTPYPHLGRYLQSQGYRFVWVVPIHRDLSPTIWQTNRRFYNPDVWITYPDLNYHGPEYSWGPSPPDQYTLGFVRDWLQHQPTQPTLVFFLTQNTHYPFSPVPPLVDDWRTLNDPNIDHPDERSKTASRQAYLEAVRYDWQVLSRFIRSADPNDVFILIGDHQPPVVSGPWDGYDTLIHIIARDETFVDSFTAYGLRPGLWPDLETSPLHHEGLYSLLVRQLVARWGVHPGILPAYRPQGILVPGILPKLRTIYRKAEKFRPQGAR